jgi:hypothetical protein
VSPWDEQLRELHTVIFHPPESDSWLPDARHRDLRLSSASTVADVVSILDGGGLVVFGAGFVRTGSGEGCDHLAQHMLEVSRRSGLALVFGIDLGMPLETGDWAALCPPAESLAFACEAGQPVLWPAKQVPGGMHAGSTAAERRVVTLAGMRVGLLISGEVFNLALRDELARAQPDVILVLTHRGPTRRWHQALESLGRIAPTFVAGECPAKGPSVWTDAPDGWVRADLGGTPSLTLHRYRPVASANSCAAR